MWPFKKKTNEDILNSNNLQAMDNVIANEVLKSLRDEPGKWHFNGQSITRFLKRSDQDGRLGVPKTVTDIIISVNCKGDINMSGGSLVLSEKQSAEVAAQYKRTLALIVLPMLNTPESKP